jgi:hypothetical protein
MIIKIDNIEIELTEDEIDQIYRERRKMFNKWDLIHKIKSYCDESDWEDEIFRPDEDMIEIGKVTISAGELQKKIEDPEWMDDLEDDFQSSLDNNDSYWESFWTTAFSTCSTVPQGTMRNT